jgi:hypothetical protein
MATRVGDASGKLAREDLEDTIAHIERASALLDELVSMTEALHLDPEAMRQLDDAKANLTAVLEAVTGLQSALDHLRPAG